MHGSERHRLRDSGGARCHPTLTPANYSCDFACLILALLLLAAGAMQKRRPRFGGRFARSSPGDRAGDRG